MAFGIQITGSDGGGTFIVQDTSIGNGIINYQVIATGVASSVPNSSFPGDARLFINGNATGATNEFITIDRNNSNTFKKVTFNGSIGSHLSNITYTTVSVNYLILQAMSAISNSGGNYGIQILTSAGVVAFDTRRLLTNTSFFLILSV